MNRSIRSELPEATDAVRGAGILEQRLELVAQPRGRQVPDEAHLDTCADEPRGVLVESEVRTAPRSESRERCGSDRR